MNQEACLIEYYQVRRHICRSFTERRPRNATSSSYPTSLTSRVFNNVVLNQHKCHLTRLCASSHACQLHSTSNNVYYNAPNLQECWVLLHWISGYVCLNYIWPVCMSVLLSPNQQPRHHCHRVSGLTYHCACLIMSHWTSIHV